MYCYFAINDTTQDLHMMGAVTIALLYIFCRVYFETIFTARRYASAVLAVVRLSVRLSVTIRYCIKTATDRILQTTPHDSLGTLVF